MIYPGQRAKIAHEIYQPNRWGNPTLYSLLQ